MQLPLSNNCNDQKQVLSSEALQQLALMQTTMRQRSNTQERLKVAFAIAFASVFFMFVIVVVKKAMNIGIGPILVATDPVFHAEIFEPEKDIMHDFVMENRGRLPIEIRMVQSDCPSCLFATINETNVLPGESTTVRVTYSPSLDKEQQSGSVAHILKVYTNYIRQETVQLIVKASKRY